MNTPTKRAAVLIACLALAACAAPKTPGGAAAAPDVKLPALPPAGEPKEFAGNNPAQLEAAFGRPAFVRRDGANELWRYDGVHCKAFFFLYAAGGNLAVQHVETIPRGGEMAADLDCLSALRAKPLS